MTTTHDADTEQRLADLTAYFVATYGETPPGYIWVGGHVPSPGAGGFQGACYVTPAEAAAAVIALDTLNGRPDQGVYHRGTTTTRLMGAHERGKDEDSASAHFFQLDLDLADPLAHKASNALPDEATARLILQKLGLPEPTMWIESGYGLYPRWVFPQHIDLVGTGDLERVRRVFDAIHSRAGALAQELGLAAGVAPKGWKVDNCGDLPRVWRVPGSMNRKGHATGDLRICRIRPERGALLSFESLERIAAAFPAPKRFQSKAKTSVPNQRAEFDPDGFTLPGESGGDDYRYTFEKAWVKVFEFLAEVKRLEVGEVEKRLNDLSVLIGHAVGAGLLSDVDATEKLLVALAKAPAEHSDEWNRQNGRSWTAEQKIRRGLEHGQRDPWVITDRGPQPKPETPAEDVSSADVPEFVDLPDRTALEIELEELPQELRRAKAREAARKVAAALLDGFLNDEDREIWRDWLKAHGDLPYGQYDAILKQAVTDRSLVEMAAHARAKAERLAERKADAQQGGKLLAAPFEPAKVARQLAKYFKVVGPSSVVMGQEIPGKPVSLYAWWRGEHYRWTGAHWAKYSAAEHLRWLYLKTEHAVYEDRDALLDWNPTDTNIRKVLHCLEHMEFFRADDEEPVTCMALENGVLRFVTNSGQEGAGAGGRTETYLLNHTPTRFNLNSVPHSYYDDAQCPRWLAFLGEVLPDPEEQRLLQQWFGYLLSTRTDRHKILVMVGPRRSGKGTVARVMTSMLGPENVAQPTLVSLAGQFGEQPLIGKTLAVMTDADWRARDAAPAIEALKAISGEDSRTVNRKNQEHWNGRLGVRFTIISNDDPSFRDPSGALAGRMLHLTFNQTFLGRENLRLTDALLPEMNGIIAWAVAGFVDLTANGWARPTSAKEQEDETLRNSSPLQAFLDDCYTPDPQFQSTVTQMHQHYEKWCRDIGRDHVFDRQQFGIHLASAVRGRDGVSKVRTRVDGGQQVVIRGLRYSGPPLDEFDRGQHFGGWR